MATYRAPKDRRRAAMSALARAMIEERGHLEDRDLAAFQEAGYGHELVLVLVLVLEITTIVAASATTNYTASITRPALVEALKPHALSA